MALGMMQSGELPRLAQPTIIAVATVYFIIVGAIGWWATRRTRTANDFFVAGEGIGLAALTLAAMSATLSGFAFIGGPALVYSLGLGAMFLILPASVTSSMTSWALAKRMRLLGEVRGLMTVPDAIGARYRSPAAQGLSGLAILIAVIGYMATNILALGLVIDAIFGTGLTWGVWIGMAIVLGYSVAGGILAGVYTDVFQGSLMAVASVLVFIYTLRTGGGMEGISRTILAADAAFMVEAALESAYEVSVAQLALRKGEHPTVLAYAEMTIRDNARLATALQALTIAKRVHLLLHPDPAHVERLMRLHQQRDGYEFDVEYAGLIGRSHSSAIGLYERALKQTRDADVRDLAGSALQRLLSRRDEAELVGADGAT